MAHHAARRWLLPKTGGGGSAINYTAFLFAAAPGCSEHTGGRGHPSRLPVLPAGQGCRTAVHLPSFPVDPPAGSLHSCEESREIQPPHCEPQGKDEPPSLPGTPVPSDPSICLSRVSTIAHGPTFSLFKAVSSLSWGASGDPTSEPSTINKSLTVGQWPKTSNVVFFFIGPGAF